jgi:3-deoxy-7-phosphoheptulonate synthase
MAYETDDLRIKEIREVVAPNTVHDECPITDDGSKTVFEARQAIHNILHGVDDRLLVITGPCSVHDTDAALEYAKKLRAVAEELKDDLVVVMRVYFEKPRTTVGWKGLINDPNLDGSFAINEGLRIARKLLVDLADMGMPTGTEFLDLISPQYVADLVSWGAIGARTTESQVHRELASGLSCPVGFKNGTDGGLQIAIDAIRSASQPHHFLSLTKEGRSAIFSTAGNDDCHIILRGGRRPNYDADSVNEAAEKLEQAGMTARIMVDCSHANSQKQPERQVNVAEDVADQIAVGDSRIKGVMLESHLIAGRQDVQSGREGLTYGQSITDACISWEQTEPVLFELAEAVRQRRENRAG